MYILYLNGHRLYEHTIAMNYLLYCIIELQYYTQKRSVHALLHVKLIVLDIFLQ